MGCFLGEHVLYTDYPDDWIETPSLRYLSIIIARVIKTDASIQSAAQQMSRKMDRRMGGWVVWAFFRGCPSLSNQHVSNQDPKMFLEFQLV